jgi:cell division protease FtsH
MSDFEEATDRLYLGLRRKSVVPTDKERRLTAYHESGHTLLGFLLKPYDMVVHKISILPRSHGSMGVTQSLPLEERFNPTEQEFRNELAAMLGARAAKVIRGIRRRLGRSSQRYSARGEDGHQWGERGTGPDQPRQRSGQRLPWRDIIKSNEHSERSRRSPTARSAPAHGLRQGERPLSSTVGARPARVRSARPRRDLGDD